jgi:hypothetical protein
MFALVSLLMRCLTLHGQEVFTKMSTRVTIDTGVQRTFGIGVMHQQCIDPTHLDGRPRPGPFDHALETTSPRDGFVFPTRELACRAVRSEQCNAHSLAGAFLDRLRA